MNTSPASVSADSRPYPAASRRSRRRRQIVTLVLGDIFGILVALMIASHMRFGSVLARIGFDATDFTVTFWDVAMVVIPLWIVLMALTGLYDLDRISWGFSETGRVARAFSMGVVLLTFMTFAIKLPGLSRGWALLVWVLSIFAVVIVRTGMAGWRGWLHRRGHMLEPTLVVGSNSESADLIRLLRAQPECGLVPVGCLASSHAEKLELDYCSGDVPVMGVARDIAEIVAGSGATTVVIASSAFDHDVLARMIAELRDVDVDVHVSSGLFEVMTSRVLVSEIAGVPLITVKGLSLSKGNILLKRVFDLIFATAILLVGLPVWLLIALGIKATSPGPVFYAQERVGRGGDVFPMLKFRSMYRNADDIRQELHESNEASGPLFKMRSDPRVTRIGRFLRKYSMDEFPQLLNVLKGEMSLVGPRPPLPHEVQKYTTHDWRRLEVVPGMTGLWQVSGRSSLTFEEMVRLDLYYIENWSVALDLTLMVRTIPAVLFARGAY